MNKSYINCFVKIVTTYLLVACLAYLSLSDFSDQFCLSVSLSIRKLSTFSTSAEDQLGIFQSKLTQSNIRQIRFKAVKLKNHTLLQR